jgi:transposase
MTTFTLSPDEISSLKITHRATKKKREADRIKTIILLGTGWAIREVSEVLLLDDETIRNYLKRYKESGL